MDRIACPTELLTANDQQERPLGKTKKRHIPKASPAIANTKASHQLKAPNKNYRMKSNRKDERKKHDDAELIRLENDFNEQLCLFQIHHDQMQSKKEEKEEEYFAHEFFTENREKHQNHLDNQNQVMLNSTATLNFRPSLCSFLTFYFLN